MTGRSAREDRDAWLQDLEIEGKAPVTIAEYRRQSGMFLADYPDKTFAEFTLDDLQRHLRATLERQRPQRQSILRSWFKWGFRTHRLASDPSDALPRLKWPRAARSDEAFSDDEIAALEALPEPDGTLMAIMFRTGLKNGEAQRLTVKMCELDTKLLRLPEAATRHPRRIPIVDDEFVERLARMFGIEGIGGDDYVWPTKPGGGRVRHDRPIVAASFHLWWKRCIAAAGVPYRMPKTARHTYADRLRRQGVPLDDLQVLLGHNEFRVTKTFYAPDRLEEIRQRLEELSKQPLDADQIEAAITQARRRIAAARGTGDRQALAEAVGELTVLVERLPSALGVPAL